MKMALHVCLSTFIDGQAYQENLLAEEKARQGHNVFVFASLHINKLDGDEVLLNPVNIGRRVVW